MTARTEDITLAWGTTRQAPKGLKTLIACLGCSGNTSRHYRIQPWDAVRGPGQCWELQAESQ
jgi:hypothetical protein